MVSYFLRAHCAFRVEWVEYDQSEGNALALKFIIYFYIKNVIKNEMF